MKLVLTALFSTALITISASASAQVAPCAADGQCQAGEICAKADYTDPAAQGYCLAESSPGGAVAVRDRNAAMAGAPVTAARGGIVAGAIVDLTGFALFVAGGAVSGMNLGVGLALNFTGGGLLTAGSVVSSASYQLRHKAYRQAGFDVETGYQTGAWVLTGLTVACYGGSLGVGLVADNLGLALASVGLNGVAAILEVVNLITVRPKWNNALLEHAAARRTVRLYPVVLSAADPTAGSRGALLGLGGVF